jgi:hypothetical protein
MAFEKAVCATAAWLRVMAEMCLLWRPVMFALFFSGCELLFALACYAQTPVYGRFFRGYVPAPVLKNEAIFVRELAPDLPMRLSLVLVPPRRSELAQLAHDVSDPANEPKSHEQFEKQPHAFAFQSEPQPASSPLMADHKTADPAIVSPEATANPASQTIWPIHGRVHKLNLLALEPRAAVPPR